MNKRIEILNNAITTKPVRIQIAKDNRWEECRIIEIDSPLDEEELYSYINSSHFDLLSVEFEFEEEDGAFVLNVSYNPEMIVKDPLEFLVQMQDLAVNYSTFASLVDGIDTLIIGKEYLFQHELDLVRLSIFNHWMSSNPVDIYVKGNEKKMNDEILKEKLNGHENLIETDLNYQAIALIYSFHNGIRHLIKVPSTIKIDNKWRIDIGKILHYLKLLESFDISS